MLIQLSIIIMIIVISTFKIDFSYSQTITCKYFINNYYCSIHVHHVQMYN